eukprot:CAMPEP_0175797760 /NCGR_PEP_ID=MMETSP0097-20121207/85632_1 /TAXON_ID=311494 /ORGANISM="Alexandrium monilatum, Strain CCMP3105" /LENGTH=424 /DNA_ID=CAMNT_0017108957 /DNA_START=315 /DNA_END=1591 /DNA_ORIENTATION=+
MSPQCRRRSWGEAVLRRGRGIVRGDLCRGHRGPSPVLPKEPPKLEVYAAGRNARSASAEAAPAAPADGTRAWQVRGDLCRRHRGPSSILPKDPPKLEVYAARRYARSASAKTAPAAPAAATRGVTNVHRGLGFSLDCPLRCPINGEPLHRGQAACQGPPAPKVTLSVGDPPVQVGEPRLGLGEAALLVDKLLLHRLGPPLNFGKSVLGECKLPLQEMKPRLICNATVGAISVAMLEFFSSVAKRCSTSERPGGSPDGKSVLSERKLPLQEMKPRLVRGAPGGAISASHVGALLGRGEALLHLRAAWRRPRLLLCAATAALDPGQLLPEVLGKVHEAPVQHLPHLRESGLARSPLIPHKCPEPLPVPRELLREVLRGRPGPVLVTGLLRRAGTPRQSARSANLASFASLREQLHVHVAHPSRASL